MARPQPGQDTCTDMQENMWARLRDSRPGACLIHATYPTYFPAFLYIDTVVDTHLGMSLPSAR